MCSAHLHSPKGCPAPLKALRAFSLAPDAVAAHVAAIAQLTPNSHETVTWCKELLAACEASLGDSVRQPSATAVAPGVSTQAIAALVTVGEVVAAPQSLLTTAPDVAGGLFKAASGKAAQLLCSDPK